MSKVEVFISHSTCPKAGSEPEWLVDIDVHHQLLRELHATLKESGGFEVFVDFELEANENYHDRIWQHIDTCFAAIILVNQQALNNSWWLDKEVTTFYNRWRQEQGDFFLFIVPLGDVDHTTIEQHAPWKPLEINKIQTPSRVSLGEENYGEACKQEIIQKLHQFREASALSYQENQLSKLITEDKDSLHDLADAWGMERPGSNLRLLRKQLTKAFYERGTRAMEDFCNAFNQLTSEIHFRVLDAVRPYWVNEVAANAFRAFVNSKESNLAFYCQKYGYTVGTYLDRIQDGTLKPKLVGGKNPEQKITTTYDPVGQVDHLNRLIKRRSSNPPQTKVLPVPYEAWGMPQDFVEKINSAYPDLKVVLCYADQQHTTTLKAQFTVFEPPMDLEQEEQEYNLYQDCIDFLEDE